MTMLKLATYFCRAVPAQASKTGLSPMVFSSSTKVLQAEKDKDHAKKCEKIKAAAEAVEKTSESLRETISSVAQDVTNTAKEVTKSVAGKGGKDSESLAGVAVKATADKIKDKVLGD